MSQETKVAVGRWAKEVKQLCDKRCAYCGTVERIEAHHIKPRGICPELSNDLTNGIALCHKHHLLAHGGSYYRVHLQKELGREPASDECAKPIIDFMDTMITVLVPKGQKQAVETHAKGKGESVNGLVNGLLRADMGLTEAEWKSKQE